MKKFNESNIAIVARNDFHNVELKFSLCDDKLYCPIILSGIDCLVIDRGNIGFYLKDSSVCNGRKEELHYFNYFCEEEMNNGAGYESGVWEFEFNEEFLPVLQEKGLISYDHSIALEYNLDIDYASGDDKSVEVVFQRALSNKKRVLKP